MRIPLYKPLGVSTHAFVKRYGDLLGEKITHTGSLDPMAEGLVVALTGKDRFRKEELSDAEKEYEFEILLGFKTDTYDLLGIVDIAKSVPLLGPLNPQRVRSDISNVNDSERLRMYESQKDMVERVKETLPKFIGSYEQVVPKFSARRINGESYFDKAKRGEEWEQKTQRVSVTKLESLGSHQVGGRELLKDILFKVNKVQGDFRQDEIIKRWNKVLNELVNHRTSEPDNYAIIRLRAVTSKRFYIRGLVRDISEEFHSPMTTFAIKRVRHGQISLSDVLQDNNDK